MNNSTTNSPVLRPSKSLRSSGQPNGGQGPGTGAGEKEPQSVYGGKIAQTALQSVGMSTKGIPGTNTGSSEYAAALSILFTKATNQAIMLGTAPGNVLSTSILYNSLLNDRRFKRVSMSEAAPGDIIIASGGHQAAGYAGIVVDHGRIVSMGTAGTVQNNCSLFEIQRNRQDVAIFRYIGVQKSRSHPLANQGYNPDEPRLPAGEPGGGQWTTGGGTDGESNISEAVREKLWSINNPKYGKNILDAADFSCDCSGMQDEMPKTLHAAISYFSHGDNALRVMVAKRWPEGVICPHCQSKTAKFMEKRQAWQCRECRKQFTVKVGTIFEDSPIKLDKWLSALWLITNAKNGISSYEIHRSLGVTQKTAWFMLHRIRLSMQSGSITKIGGHVEVDETFIGGKARNMHKGQRKVRGTGPVAMTPVMGLLERTTAKKASRVVLKVVDTTRKAELQGEVRKYVLKGSEVHTDALRSYDGLSDEYTHNVIDHAEAYVRGNVHTNGLENFWSLLKRTVKGTYVSVEPFHLFRYLDEQAFRFNERKDNDQGRFLKTLEGILGKRLTYKSLIGQDAEGLLPQTAGAW